MNVGKKVRGAGEDLQAGEVAVRPTDTIGILADRALVVGDLSELGINTSVMALSSGSGGDGGVSGAASLAIAPSAASGAEPPVPMAVETSVLEVPSARGKPEAVARLQAAIEGTGAAGLRAALGDATVAGVPRLRGGVVEAGERRLAELEGKLLKGKGKGSGGGHGWRR